MLPSLIQLKNLSFGAIKIGPRLLEESGAATEEPFDFSGVMMGEAVGVNSVGDGEEATAFVVKLRIMIANETGKKAPYDVEIEAVGLFEINKAVKKEFRVEMAEINGAAILYGAIRDLVLSLTSRCIHGPLMLPTVNFLDRRKPPAAPVK